MTVRVYKFGGTSVQDAQHVAKVIGLISICSEPLVVVTSAPSGMTDLLQSLVDDGQRGQVFPAISDRYLSICKTFVHQQSVLKEIEAFIGSELQKLDIGSLEHQRAQVMSLGERLMAPVLAASLNASGINAVSLNACHMIRTDQSYLNARVQFEQTNQLVCQQIEPELKRKRVCVIGGFIAGNKLGEITTLGRNGSDYTASIVGASLKADEVWIWTDVDGLFSADPRYHANAKLITHMSFRESAEAAYFGAKVVHPYTMWPLINSNTALRIKNTMRPQSAGTLISNEPHARGDSLLVTTIDEVAIVTVSGYGLIGVPGVAAKVFASISGCGTNVLLISQSSSEHNISFAIPRKDCSQTVAALNRDLAEWMSEEHRVDRIRVFDHVAIVTVVGENMRGRKGIAGSIFSALGRADINVLVIAQGSSEYSISIVINEADVKLATDAILSATSGGIA